MAMDGSIIPKPLRIVAVIQLISGLLSLAGILIQLMQRRVDFDLDVLGIPIYFGLMRLSSGWRTCALVFLWIGLILAPVAFVVGLGSQAPGYFQVFGMRLASISPLWLSIAATFSFFLHLWQYRVLTRPEIRALFLNPAEEPAA